MGALKTYNPKEVKFVWDGLSLESGAADTSFITLSRNERSASLTVGIHGGGTMVINSNKSVTATLTLQKGSAQNDILMDVITNEDNTDVKRVGSLTIEDYSGNSLSFGAEAFLDGPPDDDYSNDEGQVTWTWMALSMIVDVRGSSDASAVSSGLV